MLGKTMGSLGLLLVTNLVLAGGQEIQMHAITGAGIGKSIGTIKIAKSEWGLLLTPSLAGLSSGLHGFHVHEKPDCGAAEKDGKAVAGLAAGGHFDPAATGKHLGPYESKGHLGDLPALAVNAEGKAEHPVLAPRIRDIAEIRGRALVIHGGGDNYADEPSKLGGGGPRVACGVIR